MEEEVNDKSMLEKMANEFNEILWSYNIILNLTIILAKILILQFLIFIHHSAFPLLFSFKCLKKVFIAASTVDIFYASSFGMSTPKFYSIATTNYTESNESKPNYSNEAFRDSFSWLHFAAVFKISNTLLSTSSWRGVCVELEQKR